MPASLRAALLAVVLLSTARASASASASAPQVRGVVTDSAGRPIADAQVVVTQLNRVAVTNDSGRFAFTGLPTGRYHLTTLHIGFRPGHADVVIPSEGADVELRIVMARATSITQLSAVQVTATPIGTDPRDVAQSTTEISAAQLARHLSGTVAQTLSSEPGISVRYNGPAASTPVIRGLTGERILVLQDGQRTGDLSSTSSDHALSIDPLTAQRIEVVRGPASLLYGNNALGGVVNVISNDLPSTIPEHVDGYLNSSAESAAPGTAVAGGITFPLRPTLAVVGRGEARRGGDLRMGKGEVLPNSHAGNASGALGVSYVGSALTAGLLGRRHAFDYGLPSADGEDVSIDGARNELSGRLELSSPPSIFTSLRLNGTAQWYGHDEIESTGAIGTSFKLRTQTLDALGRTGFGRLSGAIGASGSFRQYSATGEEALTPAANSSGGGVFLYEELPLGTSDDEHSRSPRLQFGARYDLYRVGSEAGDPKFGAARTLTFNNFSGSIGVTLPVATGVSIGASVARAFRAPTVEELFSNAFHHAVGTYDLGNPALVSETNHGFDAVLRAQRSRVTAQVSGYVNRIANFISPTIVGDTLVEGAAGPGLVPLNRFTQGDATIRGAEGRVEVEVLPRTVLGVMGDALRGAYASGGALSYMPPARLGALARHDGTRVTFDAEYRHAFAQHRVPAAVATDDPASVATDAYDLVNLSVGYSFSAAGRLASLTARADNLFDVQYREASSRIKNFAFNPGRNLALVFRVLF
ncbi:MAG: TonB-dependent receptor plug [Gemmatimonadetes bacterium]|nr:TonB-dependent receptor plug [Gemmatimonadota bacterium]